MSSRALYSRFAARKTMNGFNFIPSVVTAKQILTKHFSLPVVFKQIDFVPHLSIAVFDIMSSHTGVSSISIMLEDCRRTCKIYDTILWINRSGSCFSAHEIVPLLATKGDFSPRIHPHTHI